jgi:N-acetylglutamate synthase-like GNAT family acetyltransferase
MLRRCEERDFQSICEIINDGAGAYKGNIPEDCCKQPYMPVEELRHEMNDGVEFWGIDENGELLGAMGIQDVQDVTLVRHAYVRTVHQGKGIGARLLVHLQALTSKPVLIGTWADARWAIRFYEHHGFTVVSHDEKERLLRRYWKIPPRQIETSVVLVDAKWRSLHPAA